MFYNQLMNREKEEKTYTEEEIKKMSYWELWGLRRKPGVWYFLIQVGIYAFMAYLFCKVIWIFASKSFEGMRFIVDWWAIPLCLVTGPLYFYLHEWYYNNIFLKKGGKKM